MAELETLKGRKMANQRKAKKAYTSERAAGTPELATGKLPESSTLTVATDEASAWAKRSIHTTFAFTSYRAFVEIAGYNA
jgi:hypothetical protein